MSGFNIKDGVLVEYTGSGDVSCIEVPEGVTSIGDNVFVDCAALREVALPDSLKIIGSSAFKGCVNLERVVANNIKEIGWEAFKGCTRLTNLDFMRSVVSIGAGAFNGCSAIEEIHFSCNLEIINSEAFSLCTIGRIVIPDGAYYKIKGQLPDRLHGNLVLQSFYEKTQQPINEVRAAKLCVELCVVSKSTTSGYAVLETQANLNVINRCVLPFLNKQDQHNFWRAYAGDKRSAVLSVPTPFITPETKTKVIAKYIEALAFIKNKSSEKQNETAELSVEGAGAVAGAGEGAGAGAGAGP